MFAAKDEGLSHKFGVQNNARVNNEVTDGDGVNAIKIYKMMGLIMGLVNVM